jgi:transposase
MSQRRLKTDYWQDAPLPREQLVLLADTLEDRIPEDHPVRLLDEILSRVDWSAWEAEYHGKAGQPPIHPSVMCKVLLFSMIRRVRSSREMEYHLRHSIDFIWLASGRMIDHTTLSEFRRKHGDRLRDLYRQVVRIAIDLKVAKLGELCIDGTRVLASASRFKALTAKKVKRLLEELDGRIQAAMSELETNDQLDDLFDDGQQLDQLPAELRDMKVRQEQLETVLARLEEMDQARKQSGINPGKKPAQLPSTDPDSRILPNKEGGYAPNYTPMAVTETENGFIVGADVLIGNSEHLAMMPMIETIANDFGQTPDTMMGDGAYCTGANIEATESSQIEFLSPSQAEAVVDNPARRDDPTQAVADEDLDGLPINSQTKRFGKQAFVYDEESDCHYCPAGKTLERSGTEKIKRAETTTERAVYQGRQCADCGLAGRCLVNAKGKRGRRVTRDRWDSARERHATRMRDSHAKKRYQRRQHFGETQFAVLKAVLNLRRFLLRGIEGVQQEWLWGCTAFNLKKLITLLAEPRARQSLVAIATQN